MPDSVLVTHEVVAELQRKKQGLEQELFDVTQQIDAMLIVLRANEAFQADGCHQATGRAARQGHVAGATPAPSPLAEAIEGILLNSRETGLTAGEIRRTLLDRKFPSPRVENQDAFYNVLAKMRQRGRIVRDEAGKYSLGPRARSTTES